MTAAQPSDAVPLPGSPRRARSRLRRVPLTVWGFLLLAGAFEGVWIFWPAVNSFYLAFTEWDGLGTAEFVGVRNFLELPGDPVFRTALVHNLIWLVGFGTLSIVLGLAFAVALDGPRPGVRVYRAVIYLPMVFSLLVTGLFWRVVYQPDGLVNRTLAAAGLDGLQQPWLAEPDIVLYAVLVAAVWRQVGYIMVLYLAGLKATDPQLADAARVDGCNAWQRFRFITWPQLRSVNTVVLAITVIDSLRTFDVVWAMTAGGPYHSSELLSTYMFRQAFTALQLGYASAIAVVIFLLTIGFIVVFLLRSLADERS